MRAPTTEPREATMRPALGKPPHCALLAALMFAAAVAVVAGPLAFALADRALGPAYSDGVHR